MSAITARGLFTWTIACPMAATTILDISAGQMQDKSKQSEDGKKLTHASALSSSSIHLLEY